MISRTISILRILLVLTSFIACRTPMPHRYMEVDSIMDSVRVIDGSYFSIGETIYIPLRSYIDYQIDAIFSFVSIDTVDCSMNITGIFLDRSSHSPLQGLQASIGAIRIGKGKIVDDGSDAPIYHIITTPAQQTVTDETGRFTIWGKASPGQHLFFVYPNYKMQIYAIDKLCPTARSEN